MLLLYLHHNMTEFSYQPFLLRRWSPYLLQAQHSAWHEVPRFSALVSCSLAHSSTHLLKEQGFFL